MKTPFLFFLALLAVYAGLFAQKKAPADCPKDLVISAARMNVLYIGADNIVQIGAMGVSADSLKVSISHGTIQKQGSGHFLVRGLTQPGTVRIRAEAGKFLKEYAFRVKRIPDPTPLLGAKFFPDTVQSGEFKAQAGIATILENFDFDVKCITVSFDVTLMATYYEDGKAYILSAHNEGARFSPESLDILRQGVPGDRVIFSNIKGACPGDQVPRKLNNLVFYLDDREERD